MANMRHKNLALICPHCNSNKVISKGISYQANFKKKQKIQCLETGCRRWSLIEVT